MWDHCFCSLLIDMILFLEAMSTFFSFLKTSFWRSTGHMYPFVQNTWTWFSYVCDPGWFIVLQTSIECEKILVFLAAKCSLVFWRVWMQACALTIKKLWFFTRKDSSSRLELKCIYFYLKRFSEVGSEYFSDTYTNCYDKRRQTPCWCRLAGRQAMPQKCANLLLYVFQVGSMPPYCQIISLVRIFT